MSGDRVGKCVELWPRSSVFALARDSHEELKLLPFLWHGIEDSLSPYANHPPNHDPASPVPFAGTSATYGAPPPAPGSLVAVEMNGQAPLPLEARPLSESGGALLATPSTLAGVCILLAGALIGALFGVVVRMRQHSLDAELAHREQLQRVERAAAVLAATPAQQVPVPTVIAAPAVTPAPEPVMTAAPSAPAPEPRHQVALALAPAPVAVGPAPRPAAKAYTPPQPAPRPRSVAPRGRDRDRDRDQDEADEEEEERKPRRATRATREEPEEERETKRPKKRSKRARDPEDVLRAAMGATRNTL